MELCLVQELTSSTATPSEAASEGDGQSQFGFQATVSLTTMF
jgi:hypothetical protein